MLALRIKRKLCSPKEDVTEILKITKIDRWQEVVGNRSGNGWLGYVSERERTKKVI